mmetsp:Transcript_4407/g.16070  ORF Transcript_4407/g.16070 Transcript_4407/m.16070 type:complete len:295 (-) Transcript_4407:171-1055(-)
MEHELDEDCLGHYGFCPDSSRTSRIRKTMMPNQVDAALRNSPASCSSGLAGHNHSFLGKYGVGACLTPASVKIKNDSSNPTYWLRRMGLMQTSVSSQCHKAEQKSSKPKSNVKFSASTKRTRRRLTAHHHALQETTKLNCSVIHETKQHEKCEEELHQRLMQPRRGSEGNTCTEDNAGEQAGVTRRKMDQESPQTTEEVQVKASHHSDASASDVGSVDLCLTPASSCVAAGRMSSSVSECGDSWSVASGSQSSSFSLISALQLESIDGTGAQEGPSREAAMYRAVLLMSDGEVE